MMQTSNSSQPGLIGRFFRWLFSWRTVRRALIGFVGLITLLALFLTEEGWRGKRDWEKYKSEMAAKGEKLDIEDLAPPRVPDDQNFAMAPIWKTNLAYHVDANGDIELEGSPTPNLSIDALSPADAPGTGNWMKGRKADLATWQAYYRGTNNIRPPIKPLSGAATFELQAATFFPVAATPQTPAADVLLAFSRYDQPLSEIRQAAQRPFCRLQTNYQDVVVNRSMVSLKGCGIFLTLRSKAELASDNTAAALDDVKLQPHLVEMTRAEPFFSTHWVRLAMVNIALGSIWEGLADHRWSEAQLAAIQEELNKLDFLADYEHAMRGECAFSLSMLQEEMRMGGPTDISVPGQSTSNIPRWQRMVSVLLRGFYYENLISVSQAHEAWTLPSVNLENRLVSLKIPTALQQNPRGWHPYSMFARLLMPAIDKSVVKFARAQCLLDQARVACALERYWLANQRYPDSLEALVPKLVSTLPHDIMDGKPLRYHPTGDGHFVLYSVGWNKTDEGGIAGQQKNGNLDVTTGDWPWPMAEVK